MNKLNVLIEVVKAATPGPWISRCYVSGDNCVKIPGGRVERRVSRRTARTDSERNKYV